jgi:hypothetical protein
LFEEPQFAVYRHLHFLNRNNSRSAFFNLRQYASRFCYPQQPTAASESFDPLGTKDFLAHCQKVAFCAARQMMREFIAFTSN